MTSSPPRPPSRRPGAGPRRPAAGRRPGRPVPEPDESASGETARQAAARIAAGLPPLTDQQRDRLAVLLGAVRPAAPRRRQAAEPAERQERRQS